MPGHAIVDPAKTTTSNTGSSGGTGSSGSTGGSTITTPAGVGGVVFLANDTVFYIATAGSTPKPIVTTYGGKSSVKISHDHTKIAYKYFGDIEIDDINGNKITRLTQYNYTECFDWSLDDKTLYILDNSKISYYGPSMNLPAFIYPTSLKNNTNSVISASVSTKGDLAYVILSDAGGYELYEMCIIPSGSSTAIEYTNNSGQYVMSSVNFSDNAQDLVLGYQSPHNNFINMTALDLFTGLKTSPDKHIESANEWFCNAVYKSNLGYLVAGYNGNTGPQSNSFLAIRDVATNKNTQTSTLHSAGIGTFYSDWK